MKTLVFFHSIILMFFLQSFLMVQGQGLPHLQVDGEVMVVHGSDHLTISNIGSSGIDGIRFDVETTLQMHTTHPGTSRQVHMQLDPIAAPDSFFDIFVNDGSNDSRLRLSRIDSSPFSGLRLHLADDKVIEGRENSGGLGDLVFAPNQSLGGDRLVLSNIGATGDDGVRLDLGNDLRVEFIDDTASTPSGQILLFPDRSAGHDHLTISNIGSSGEDGVCISIREDVPTEIIQMDLVGSPGFDPGMHINLAGMKVEHTRSSDEIMILLRPAPGSPAPTHEFRYDTDPTSLLITEKGPPNYQYENSNLVTRYEYDSVNRIIRQTFKDESSSAQPDLMIDLNLDLPPGTPLPRVDLFGDLFVSGTLSKSAGSFRIDHPLDPENKYLSHSFVESPDMMNIYNGNVVTNESCVATVELPDYFEALNTDYRYQLTVIGDFAQAIIKEKICSGKFVIQSNKPNVEVSWQVTGIRNDKYARENRIVVESSKINKDKKK